MGGREEPPHPRPTSVLPKAFPKRLLLPQTPTARCTARLSPQRSSSACTAAETHGPWKEKVSFNKSQGLLPPPQKTTRVWLTSSGTSTGSDISPWHTCRAPARLTAPARGQHRYL